MFERINGEGFYFYLNSKWETIDFMLGDNTDNEFLCR